MKPEHTIWLQLNCSNIIFDEPMQKHTSFNIGGCADAFIKVSSIDELKNIIVWAKKNKIFYFVIGGGSNILIKDNGIRGVVIFLKFLNKIKEYEKKESSVLVNAEAGAKLSALCRFAEKKGYKGMSFAAGIPGSVGGAIIGNAGSFSDSISDVIKNVTILNAGLNKECEIEIIDKKDINFSYRKSGFKKDSIVLSACFEFELSNSEEIKKESKTILEIKKEKQPQKVFCAGSFFKNPDNEKAAGELIELAGFKGMKAGDAQVSDKHANFIINKGGAKASDVIELANIIKKTVKDKFNIMLEPEVKIIGD
jgi:UDP-N-acetylmuramate dehydrogenase